MTQRPSADRHPRRGLAPRPRAHRLVARAGPPRRGRRASHRPSGPPRHLRPESRTAPSRRGLARTAAGPATASPPAIRAFPAARGAAPHAAPPWPCEAARGWQAPPSATGPGAIPRIRSLLEAGVGLWRRLSADPAARAPQTRGEGLAPCHGRDDLQESSGRATGCQPEFRRDSSENRPGRWSTPALSRPLGSPPATAAPSDPAHRTPPAR